MRKIKILINIGFFLSFIALLWSLIIACKNLNYYIEEIKHFSELGWINDAEVVDFYVKPTIEYSILVFFNIFAIICIPSFFVYCNPRLFRRSTWENLSEEWTKTKAERAAARKEKSVEDKEKRLQELQAELKELKKE